MEKPIKRVLVPLDPSMYADAATKTACRIAKQHDAEIAGVVVLDSAEITSSLVPAIGPCYPMMIEALQEKKKHAGHILEDCMARFADTCEKAGVRHFETKWEGLPAEKLLESSIFFDLIVIGLETFFHFETRGENDDNGRSLSRLLNRTITPVLAVPAKALEKFERALITFDGSLSSARALQDFAIFAQPFDFEITVFVAGKTKQESEFLLTGAREFLGAHGLLEVTTRQEPNPIESSLEPEYLDSFDLIVAGIHSKQIIKDFFVGSFTKSLIHKGTKPVFLSH